MCTWTVPDEVPAYEDGEVQGAVGHRVVHDVGRAQRLLHVDLPLTSTNTTNIL